MRESLPGIAGGLLTVLTMVLVSFCLSSYPEDIQKIETNVFHRAEIVLPKSAKIIHLEPIDGPRISVWYTMRRGDKSVHRVTLKSASTGPVPNGRYLGFIDGNTVFQVDD